MKKTRMAARLLIAFCLAFSAAACSSSEKADGLSRARKEIRESYPEVQVPRIEGLELRLAYREKAFSPERGLGGDAESGEGVAKDNFVFVYTDQKGGPEDLDPRLDGPLNGEQLLYGPYEGDDVMTLKISDLPAKVRGAEELDIDGAAVQKAALEVGSLYAVARSSGVTYTMETNSASGREEEEWLGILAKISKGEKN